MRGLTLGNTDNTITASQLNLSNSLNWQHRFKKAGRTLFADFSFGTTRQNEDGKLLSLVDFTNTTADQVTDQQYLQTGRGHTVSVHATYTEPVAKHQIVSLSYNVSYANNQLQKNAFNLNDATGKYEMPDSTNSNELDNENSLHKIAVGYNYNGGRLKYQSGASLSYGELKTNNRGIVPRNATQYNLNWAPSVGVNYQVSRRQNIGIQYSGANQMPGADMLQPLPDIPNPFIIRVGNPNLRQQFSHNASMNYALYNDKTFNTFLVSLSGSATTNKLTQASLITSGGIQQLQYINVNGVYNVGGNVAYTYSINKGRNGAVSAAAYIQHSRDISFVNAVKNVYTGITITQSVNLNYHLAELLYVNVNANLSAANGRYAIGSDLNTKNVSQAYDADVTYRLPWQLYLNSSFRINRIGSQRNFAAQSVSTLNASIFKTMMKNRGELRLDAFDLLNQNTGISRVIGNNYVETSESNVLQRYFLLTFKYRFSISPRTK